MASIYQHRGPLAGVDVGGDLPYEDLALLTMRDAFKGQDWEGHIAKPVNGMAHV